MTTALDFDTASILPQTRLTLAQPLRVATLNIRGIIDDSQQRNLFRHLRTLHLDITCLQETHTPDTERAQSRWTLEWGALAAWSPHLGILLSSRLSFMDTS